MRFGLLGPRAEELLCAELQRLQRRQGATTPRLGLSRRSKLEVARRCDLETPRRPLRFRTATAIHRDAVCRRVATVTAPSSAAASRTPTPAALTCCGCWTSRKSLSRPGLQISPSRIIALVKPEEHEELREELARACTTKVFTAPPLEKRRHAFGRLEVIGRHPAKRHRQDNRRRQGRRARPSTSTAALSAGTGKRGLRLHYLPRSETMSTRKARLASRWPKGTSFNRLRRGCVALPHQLATRSRACCRSLKFASPEQAGLN